MSEFGKGKVGFSVLRVGFGPMDDAVLRMKEHALPALLGDSSLRGWTGWRHVQDRTFDEQSCRRGGYFTGRLVTAQKKIPKSTLEAEVALELAAVMRADNRLYVNMKERREIVDSVKARLLPDMPWTFSSTEFVWLEDGEIFVTATSDSALDDFSLCFQNTFGRCPAVLDPAHLAVLIGFDASKWIPVCLAGQGNLFVIEGAGREFLMWLWFCMETGRAVFEADSKIDYMVSGGLTLAFDDRVTTVRKGNPLVARETVSALRSGKVLTKCSLAMTRGEMAWECSFGADAFAFKGMKLPPTEQFDMEGKFAERVVHLVSFVELFTEFFRAYCELRASAGWNQTVRDMRDWIREKGAKGRTDDVNDEMADYSQRIDEAFPEAVMAGTDGTDGTNGTHGTDDDEDEVLVEQAMVVIRETGKASTSGLQRRLQIGYTRAARLIDLLEDRGVIGPANGVRPREVL